MHVLRVTHVSRDGLGIVLIVTAFGVIRMLPSAKMFKTKTGEPVTVILTAVCAQIIALARSKAQSDETG
ncbi:MAG TPA: hypothetical protein VN397_00875 [Candidatus Methylomirabilis sp.]|nr:hypothetical protein [Candidatus Methylomirabilis sp.]